MPYAIAAIAASGGTFNPANYTIAYVDGRLTIILPAATVTASRVVLDSFGPVSLPENAHQVSGAPLVVTSLGFGMFYADPRFAMPFICFGGGNRTAQSCFPVHQ